MSTSIAAQPSNQDAPETSRAAWISTLQLSDFRNYEHLHLQTDGRHVVLSGENGSGKTNILEALSLLTPGRGLRRIAYDAMRRHGAVTPWSIAARVHDDGYITALGTGQEGDSENNTKRRRVRIDGENARAQDFLEFIRLLWLSPSMDGLFAGPAGGRRKFADRLALTLDPAHARRVTAFEQAMRQRNRLLEQRPSDALWLDGIEMQMAQYGVAIAAARLEMVACLRVVIGAMREAGSVFPWAEIAMEGTLETALGDVSAIEVEDRYRQTLRDERDRDRAAGRTLAGPHRADFAVVHGPGAMAAGLCSTGEQKALLLGLVLAHAQLVKDTCRKAPVLLLDEVAAHLDERRRHALFDTLNQLGCQAWMTGTETHIFAGLGPSAQYFAVARAVVTAIARHA